MQVRRAPRLSDTITPFFRFKWRFLFLLTAAIAAAAAWAAYGDRSYESEAKLFVRIGRENAAMDPTLRSGETIGLRASREEEINSIVEHLKSRAILEQAFDEIYKDREFESPIDRERTLRGLGESVEITSPRASTVIAVWAQQDSPEKAQTLVQALVKVYLDEHMRIHRSPQSYEFFQSQTEVLQERLTATQTQLRDAKNKVGIGSVKGRRSSLESQINTLESKIQSVDSDLAATTAKIAALRVTADELPETLLQQLVGGTPNDGLAAMQAQLFDLRVREKQMLTELKPNHPKFDAIRDQIAQVTDALESQDAERTQLVDALLSEQLATEASLKAQREQLETQLETVSTELADLNGSEVEILELERNLQQLETDYLAYAEKRELARMDQQLRTDRISNLSIMQPASYVADHISPRPAKTLILGGAAGLLLGCLAVFLSEQLDTRVRSIDGVYESELEQLASIPRLPSRELQEAETVEP